MRSPFAIITAFAILILPACAIGDYSYQDYLQKKELRALQTQQSFQHCYSYGCKDIAETSLDAGEWSYIAAAFDNPQTAAEERESIAQAIAVFENIIGAKTGTEADKAGTYAHIAPMSHDCVDESVNTTIYLALLAQNGLLKFHSLNGPTSRIPILRGRFAPHQTAVITEKSSGIRYAVDSWFYDNGHPAEIIALDTWKKGWHPPEKTPATVPHNKT